MTLNERPAKSVARGLVAGAVGGACFVLLAIQGVCPLTGEPLGRPTPWVFDLVLSTLLGPVFTLTLGRYARDSGSGLCLGMVFGFLWWILGPLTLLPIVTGGAPCWTLPCLERAFPLLVGDVAAFGAVVGLVHAALHRPTAPMGRDDAIVTATTCSRARAITFGAIAGAVAGGFLAIWAPGDLPTHSLRVAETDSPMAITPAAHIVTSTIVGITYGLSFRRLATDVGASVTWGFAFGTMSWIIGPLTLVPWFIGGHVHWSLAAGRDAAPWLRGHWIFGLTLGVSYAALARLWRLLFVDSDPVLRARESPGLRGFRLFAAGLVAASIAWVITGPISAAAGASATTAPWLCAAALGVLHAALFRSGEATLHQSLGSGLVFGCACGLLAVDPFGGGASQASGSVAGGIAAWTAFGGLLATVQRLLVRYLLDRIDADARPPGAADGGSAPQLWWIVVGFGVVLAMVLHP